MGTVDDFMSRGGFTAEELLARGQDHHVATAAEDDDPRSLRGEDLDPDTDGWD